LGVVVGVRDHELVNADERELVARDWSRAFPRRGNG
jgi:hypothetical protein